MRRAAGKHLLDVGVERAEHAVELVLVEGRERQLAPQEHRVLDADREVRADELLVAAQQVLVELAWFSSGAGIT